MVKFPLAKREPRVRFPVDAAIPLAVGKWCQIITRLNSGVEFLVVAQNVAGSIPAVEIQLRLWSPYLLSAYSDSNYNK